MTKKKHGKQKEITIQISANLGPLSFKHLIKLID